LEKLKIEVEKTYAEIKESNIIEFFKNLYEKYI
jgi:hypothetical protein